MFKQIFVLWALLASVEAQDSPPASGATLTDDVSDADFAVCDDNAYCIAGQYAISACTNDSDPVCQDCPDGSWSDEITGDSTSQCTFCAAGKAGTGVAKTSEATGCETCAENSYSSNAGSASCTPCPIGYSGNGQTGQITRDTACTICSPGTAQGLTGQSDCTACESGYFQDLQGQSACKQCRSCGNTQYIQTACSATSDTVCGDCTCENTSCDPNSGVCANDVCGVQDGDGSTCCAGNPNYCGVSGTCVGGTTDLSCVCGPGYGIENGVCVQCSSEQPFEFNGANNASPCGEHTPCEDNFRFEYSATQEGCVACDSGFELDQSGDGFLTTCTQIDDCNCPTGDTCEDATNEFTCSRLFNKDEDSDAVTLTLINGLIFSASTQNKVIINSNADSYEFELFPNAHGLTTVSAERVVDGITHKYAYTFVINKINDDVPQWKADFGTYDNIKDGDVEYFDLGQKIIDIDGVATNFQATADASKAIVSMSNENAKIHFISPGNVVITFSVSGAGGTSTKSVTFSVKDCKGDLGGTAYRVGRLCRSSKITIGTIEIDNSNFDTNAQNRENIIPLDITDKQTAKQEAFQYTSSLKKKSVMSKADRRDRKDVVRMLHEDLKAAINTAAQAENRQAERAEQILEVPLCFFRELGTECDSNGVTDKVAAVPPRIDNKFELVRGKLNYLLPPDDVSTISVTEPQDVTVVCGDQDVVVMKMVGNDADGLMQYRRPGETQTLALGDTNVIVCDGSPMTFIVSGSLEVVICEQHGTVQGNECVCNQGYAGENCDLCAAGYGGDGSQCLACADPEFNSAETEIAQGCATQNCPVGQGLDWVNTTFAQCEQCDAGSTFSVVNDETVCQSCTTCNSGEYQSQTCTASEDRQCTQCDTCLAETYETQSCTSSTNRLCTACLTCTGTQYQTQACTASSNRVCADCTVCQSGEYETQSCGGENDRQCTSCSQCPAEKYKTGGCTGTQNTECADCSLCTAYQTESQACTSTQNRVCANITTCDDVQYATHIYVETVVASPYYKFYSDQAGTNELSSLTFSRGLNYTFERINGGHPFYIGSGGWRSSADSGLVIRGAGSPTAGIDDSEKLTMVIGEQYEGST